MNRKGGGSPDPRPAPRLALRTSSISRIGEHAEAGASARDRGPAFLLPPALRAMNKRAQRGQSMVENTFVLIVFFMLLFAVIDCGQVLVAHQALVERVRSSVRWGVVRPWDGTGDQVANLILYSQPEAPNTETDGYLGLARENVHVSYRPAAPERPDDESITVAIVDYHYRFLSPWVTSNFVNPRPVLVSAPMAYRVVTAN